ncbi:MAG: hypothetical protein KDK56_06030 [Simkania sp.]|nr:hypothetical protein [Simkania sp.]MCB1075529.1 hypothetical protein [Simkania sp.]MCP5490527.1 hypothetical protein [Chlamydiales bacterium]
MATSSATSTNQEAYSKLQTCVSKGYGIQVGLVTRNDVTYKRYVIPYDKDGNPIRTSELQRALDPANVGIDSVNIQKINDLAQSILNPHREAHDTSNEKKAQNAFFDERGVHFVKSDKADDEDSVSHQEQSLKTTHLPTYFKAFGGIKDGMTGDQKAVLDLEATLGSKTVEGMTRDEIDGALDQIKDKNFVRLFRKFHAEASPTTPLQQVYRKALKIYVKDTVNTFQVSLNPASLDSVTKELNKTAHAKFDPGVTDRKEMWLQDNVDNLGDPKYAKAVFQAIHEVGTKEVDSAANTTNTTVDHAYQALISKVNDCWLEAHRLTAIARVDVIDVPVDPRSVSLLASTSSPTGIHGSTPTIRMVKATDVLTKPDPKEIVKDIEFEIKRVEEQIEKIDEALDTPFDLYGFAAQDAVEKAAETFSDLMTDTNTYMTPDQALTRLRTKIAEFEKDKEAIISYHQDPINFGEKLEELKKELSNSTLPEKPYTLNPFYQLGYGEYNATVKKRESLETQIAQMEKILNKTRSQEDKMTLVKSLLHYNVDGAKPTYSDYKTLTTKLLEPDKYPEKLTKGEIAALQTWQVPDDIDTSNSETLLSSLRIHLDHTSSEVLLPEIKAKLLEVDITAPEYINYSFKKSDYRAANDLLYGEGGGTPADLNEDHSKGTLYALRKAHEEGPITKDAEEPTVWREAMSKVLKEEEFKAIHSELEARAGELPPNKQLEALKLESGYTTWDTDESHADYKSSQDYKTLYEYLIGKNEAKDMSLKAIYAYMSLPEVPDTITDPAKKITFLIEQARANYVLCKLNETGMPTLDGSWKPTPKDFRDARAWLKDPVSSEPSPESRAIIITGVLTQEMDKSNLISELDKVIRVIDLEELPEFDGVDGHAPSKEDLLAVEAFLNGSSEGPLIDSQIKTYKKMEKNTPPPPTAKPLEKAAHYQKQIAEQRFKQVTEGVDVGSWSPKAKHFEDAKLWLESTSHAKPTEDVQKALAYMKSAHSLTSNFKDIQDSLAMATRIFTLEEKLAPTNLATYNPTSADYKAVDDYLAGTLGRDLDENELKAFKQMQTATTTTFDAKIDHYAKNLYIRPRILELEAEVDPLDLGAYNLKSEHVEAMTKYLDGRDSTKPTGDTLKAFKKMQKDPTLPASMNDKVLHYSKEKFQMQSAATKHGNLDWKSLWSHVESFVKADDIADSGLISKEEHEEAIRKFKAKEAFANDNERFLIQKWAREAHTKYGTREPEFGKAVLLLFYLENTIPA